MSIRVVQLACSLAVSLASLGSADTVTLTSGKVIEDVAVKDEGDKVRLTKPDGSSSVWPKSMIQKVEYLPTPAEELVARRKALADKDVASRLALAAWCNEKKMPQGARKVLEEVLSLDPTCEAAHKGLDHFLFNGRWFPTPQALVDEELPKAKGDLRTLRSIVALCDARGLRPPDALLQAILALSPEDADTHKRLGHMRVGTQWFANLDAAFEEITRNKEAGTSEAYLELGGIYKKAQLPEKLKTVVEAGIKAYPESRALWASLLEDTPWELAAGDEVKKRVSIEGLLFGPVAAFGSGDHRSTAGAGYQLWLVKVKIPPEFRSDDYQPKDFKACDDHGKEIDDACFTSIRRSPPNAMVADSADDVEVGFSLRMGTRPKGIRYCKGGVVSLAPRK